MIFKIDWEKTTIPYQLSNQTIEQMVKLAFPDEKLDSYHVIAGGCANINTEVKLVNHQKSLLLRIYIRDKDAAFREQKLGNLLHRIIPIPRTNYIGESDGYHFAITEFLPGITLRALLLSENSYNLALIMNEVGSILAKINNITFDKAGFFDKTINVTQQINKDIYLDYIKGCLDNSFLITNLGKNIVDEIRLVFKKYRDLLPSSNETNLVHGDFDPANILVEKIDGQWRVTGILDWEFAFSGSILFDIANMLRYAHQMPVDFQNSFLRGVKEGGIILPKEWHITMKLLNIGSLLDIMNRSDLGYRTVTCADSAKLINHMLQELRDIP